MRTHLLSVFIVLLTIISIAVIAYGDSGYFVVYSETIVFDRLPYQTALVTYRGGYEYLFVITNFLIRGSSTRYNIIYYFPLPEKPVSFNLVLVNGNARFSAEIEYRRDVLKDYLNQHIVFRSLAVLGGTRGSVSSRYIELATITNPFLNISLVKAVEPDISIFEQILKQKGYRGEIPSSLNDIIQYYRDKGWKYFVVGLVTVPSTFNLIQQYVFKTDKIVYPLYIDKLNNELSARIATYIVTDHVIDKIVDPISGKEVDAGKYFKGLNYKLVIESGDKDTLANFYESLKEIIEDPEFPSELRDMISIRLGSRLTMEIKGLVYVFDEDDIPLPSIKSDLIATLNPINDLTFQLIDNPAILLPSVVFNFLAFGAIVLALVPIIGLVGAASMKKASGKAKVSSYVMAYILLYLIIILTGSYISLLIINYTPLLLLTRLLGLVIWVSPIIALAILTDDYIEKFIDVIKNYMIVVITILVFTCWYPLNVVSPFLIVASTLLFYNNIRFDIKEKELRKHHTVFIVVLVTLLAIIYGFIVYAGLT